MSSQQPLDQLKTVYLSGRDPLAYIPYVTRLIEEKQYAQSLDICIRGLAARPSIAGKRLLARIQFETGHYQDALALLDEILQEAPESFAAQVLLAKTWLRCGRWHEAKDLVEKLGNQNPNDKELQKLSHQIREDLERSEQPTPLDLDPFVNAQEHKAKFCEHFKSQQGVGFCFFQRPLQGNVLETSEMETLFGYMLEKSDRITSTLGLGEFQEIMIEFEQGYVISRRMEDEFLTAQFKREVSPGHMRQTLSRYFGSSTNQAGEGQ